jgi:hypothetical protein
MQASGAVSPVSNRDEPAAASGSRLVTGVTAQVTRSAEPWSAGRWPFASTPLEVEVPSA